MSGGTVPEIKVSVGVGHSGPAVIIHAHRYSLNLGFRQQLVRELQSVPFAELGLVCQRNTWRRYWIRYTEPALASASWPAASRVSGEQTGAVSVDAGADVSSKRLAPLIGLVQGPWSYILEMPQVAYGRLQYGIPYARWVGSRGGRPRESAGLIKVAAQGQHHVDVFTNITLGFYSVSQRRGGFRIE